MQPETRLALDLDERNLAHFLSGLALAALAERVEGSAPECRRCWWPEPGTFAIDTEHPCERFRSLLFATAYQFLKAIEWYPGLRGAADGILVSRSEVGVNPFVALAGRGSENTPLKGFSARVLPGAMLLAQRAKLPAPHESENWINCLDKGAGSWGFDCRVNMHASDAGISSDAEGTGHSDPFYPAVELLGLAGAAFFAPVHGWQRDKNALNAFAWSKAVPLPMTTVAASGHVHGLPGRRYRFAHRGAAHGKGSAYHFFPPAALQRSTP
jgi:hypothetical protein